jgi:hypothetical protein
MEPMQIVFGFSHKGKTFRPTSAGATWDHDGKPDSINLRGPVLKKDGTAGANHACLTFVTPASHWYNRAHDEAKAPEWLLELFADAPGQGDK